MVRLKTRPSPLSYFSVTGFDGDSVPEPSCCHIVFWSGIRIVEPVAGTQPNSA